MYIQGEKTNKGIKLSLLTKGKLMLQVLVEVLSFPWRMVVTFILLCKAVKDTPMDHATIALLKVKGDLYSNYL